MQLPEEKIIASCQDNPENFALLYDAYFEKIHRFVYFKTSHRETAQDIVSEVFLKALKNIRSFNAKKGTFQAWLFKIARNAVVDYYRKKKNLVNVEDVWGLKEENSFLQGIEVKEKMAKVRPYLSKLTVLQREIIILRVWQDMSYKEIADILSRSEGSCKMVFSRTMKKLRAEMPLELFLLCLFLF